MRFLSKLTSAHTVLRTVPNDKSDYARNKREPKDASQQNRGSIRLDCTDMRIKALEGAVDRFELYIDDTQKDNTIEGQAVSSWAKLLISTMRINPNQEYGASFIHPIIEEDVTDPESAAIHRVFVATTWPDIVNISLDEQGGERQILSRLRLKRDNLKAQILKGEISRFDAVAELKDEAVAIFEKYYREPWDQMTLSQFKSQWHLATKTYVGKPLDLRPLTSECLEKYATTLEHRKEGKQSRAPRRNIIFIISRLLKDLDMLTEVISDFQSKFVKGDRGLHIMLLSVCQDKESLLQLKKVDNLSKRRQDNIDAVWIPAPYIVAGKPPAKILEKIFSAGMFEEIDQIETDCGQLYTDKQRRVVEKTTQWENIMWDPNPFDETIEDWFAQDPNYTAACAEVPPEYKKDDTEK
ncbi:hypothetical protein F5884DRAFT_862800 [Xylogone sp. PMI_703]|nr:hypothetical protein F5884DRAFT_862800 [Xylogone sp. PMI_703]